MNDAVIYGHTVNFRVNRSRTLWVSLKLSGESTYERRKRERERERKKRDGKCAWECGNNFLTIITDLLSIESSQRFFNRKNGMGKK